MASLYMLVVYILTTFGLEGTIFCPTGSVLCNCHILPTDSAQYKTQRQLVGLIAVTACVMQRV